MKRKGLAASAVGSRGVMYGQARPHVHENLCRIMSIGDRDLEADAAVARFEHLAKTKNIKAQS